MSTISPAPVPAAPSGDGEILPSAQGDAAIAAVDDDPDEGPDEGPPGWRAEAARLFAEIGEPDLSGLSECMARHVLFYLRLVCDMHARRPPDQRPCYRLCAFDALDVEARARVAEHVRARARIAVTGLDLPMARR